MEIFSQKNNSLTAEKDPLVRLKKIQQLLKKYIYPLTIAVSIIIFIIAMVFIYFNVWLAIGHGQNVANLKKQVPEETLQTDKLDQALQNLQTRKANITDSLKTLNNPFEKK